MSSRRRVALAQEFIVERMIEIDNETRLWVQDIGDRSAEPVLLIMGANASGMAWPDLFIERLAQHHRVIRYDHRDTGKSSHAFDQRPYAIADLAEDAVAVLDGLEIDRAHIVGMSMGGILAQLLLIDHPERLHSATVFCTASLGAELAAPDDAHDAPTLPGPDPHLLELWQQLTDSRTRDEEIAWRLEHWRILNGTAIPFDANEFRRLEERVIDHTGTHETAAAHARADQEGLDRRAELTEVRTPLLVIDAPEDPINPPPHAARLAASIPGARLVSIAGMGNALSEPIIGPLAEAISQHVAGAKRQING